MPCAMLAHRRLVAMPPQARSIQMHLRWATQPTLRTVIGSALALGVCSMPSARLDITWSPSVPVEIAIEPLTLEQLEETIRHTRQSAPGPDGASYDAQAQCGDAGPCFSARRGWPSWHMHGPMQESATESGQSHTRFSSRSPQSTTASQDSSPAGGWPIASF